MNFHHANVFFGKIVFELKSNTEVNIDFEPNIEFKFEFESESKNINFALSIEFKSESKSKKALFEKTISEIEFQNSVNFLTIESIDSNDVIKPDVNDH